MQQWLVERKCVIQCQKACRHTAVQSNEYKCNTIRCQGVSHKFSMCVADILPHKHHNVQRNLLKNFLS